MEKYDDGKITGKVGEKEIKLRKATIIFRSSSAGHAPWKAKVAVWRPHIFLIFLYLAR